GLVLVSGIAVVGASLKSSVGKLFDDNVRADYILTTDVRAPVPLRAADAVRRVPGVASVTELHELHVRIDGAEQSGTAVDGPLTAAMRVDVKQGSAGLGARGMLVSRSSAK